MLPRGLELAQVKARLPAGGVCPGEQPRISLAVPLAGQTFVERMTTKASNVIPLPHGTDPLQAAMLKANPASWLDADDTPDTIANFAVRLS